MKRIPTPQENSRLLGLVTAVVVVATLYLAQVVFIPLALALLFSLLLTPPVAFLERIKLPRILAIFLVVVTLAGLMGAIGWKAVPEFIEIATKLPTYKKTLEDKIHALKGARTQDLKKASDTVKQLGKEIASVDPGPLEVNATKKPPATLGSSESRPLTVEVVPTNNPLESIERFLGPLTTAGVVMLFTVFILAGREDLRDRFIRLAGGHRLYLVTQAFDEATQRINRYLLLQALVNTGYGLVVFTALHFLGIPNAILWGVSTTILRFLPYVGPPLAALMPIGLSLAVFPGWHAALITASVFIVLELIVSNFVEPLLYGAHLGLSPLAILVAAVFWTLIWGLPGLVLATPLTVCLVVLGRYVPNLGFLQVLLGDEAVLPPHTQFYQRLLSGDQNEARKVLEQYLKDKSLEELYSSVVIPALSLAEQDRHHNKLDEETENYIYKTVREIVGELSDRSAEGVREGTTENSVEVISEIESTGPLDVLCIPARDEADEVVGMLLVRLLLRRGCKARGVSIATRTEMLAQVAKLNPRVVCISALPPFAVNHVRALYSQLQTESPDLHIVICLWQFEGNSQRAALRIKLSREHQLFTTLAQVAHHITFQAEKIMSGAKHS